jgi:hypothetical protein
MANGTKNGRKNAMEDRVDSDTDNTSTSYLAYEARVFASGFRVGNGRRLIAVPINAGPNCAGNNGNGGGSSCNGSNGNGNGNGGKSNGNGNGNGNDDENGNGNGNGNGGGGTGGMEPRTVLGFAAFFLDDLAYDDAAGNEPFCGQYVGTYVQGANSHSGGNAGVAKLRLVQ